MEIEVTVNGNAVMDAIFEMVGDDFDSIADFEKAVRGWGPIGFDATVDKYNLEDAVTDEWIEEQYNERFSDANYVENIDLVAATAALAKGDHAMARTLFDRAGRPDLGSEAVGR